MSRFIISAGEVAALDRATPAPNASMRITSNLTQTYTHIWRTQQQVRTAVGFLARNIAQLGIHVFERTSDTDRKRLTDHPLAVLFAEPYPRQSRYQLMNALMHDLGIFDAAYLLKVKRADGRPSLLRLPPTNVTPVGESWIEAEGYRFRGSKGYRDYDPDELVVIHGYNPDDSRLGVSPLESLRRILAEEYEAGTWREQMWRNGLRASGHIRRPAGAKWTDDALKRFRESWQGVFTGNGPGAGGTPVLEDGMSFESGGMTPEQAEYLESRKLTRSECAAAYYIPAPFVGILDNATFSNITEQHKNLYQDTLGPWLTQIREAFGIQLVPDLADGSKVYVDFNLREKLRGSFEEESASLQTSTGGPWLTRNEARARQDLPAIEGGDELIVPLNVVTGGQASPTDSAPKGWQPVYGPFGLASGVEEPKAAAVLTKFLQRQGAAVLSAIGSKAQWWDAKRWNSELANDLLSLGLGLFPDADPVALAGAAEGYAVGLNAETEVYLRSGPPADVVAAAADRASSMAGELVTALRPGGPQC